MLIFLQHNILTVKILSEGKKIITVLNICCP
jgi:hypothetical protein